MFAARFFAARHFAPRYFPEHGLAFSGGSRAVQLLNFVVYQSYDALLAGGEDDAANADEDAGVEWLDDWSTANGPNRPVTPPGMVRRVRPGGSGVQRNRRRPVPVFRLTITADDEAKAVGTVFTWDGDEFTDAGLQ